MTDLPARVKELRAKMTPGPWEEWAPEGPVDARLYRHSVCKNEGGHECVANAIGRDKDVAYSNAAAIALLPELMDAYLEAVEARAVTVDDLWQPIKTAPKDGTWIDVWAIAKNGTGGGRLDCISWLKGAWRWPNVHSDSRSVGHDTAEHWTVTHWQPRPKGPRALAKGGDHE